jgi:hypothetical protein
VALNKFKKQLRRDVYAEIIEASPWTDPQQDNVITTLILLLRLLHLKAVVTND